MKFLVDYGDLAEIRSLYEMYPLDGVTTNPTILRRAGKPPFEALKAIRAFIGEGGELHAQVASPQADIMVEEAQRMRRELGENTYVKVPVTKEGLVAIREISRLGIPVTATIVYTPMQALMAALAGAQYVAPYVNKIDNLGGDGPDEVKTIHNMLRANELDCQVIAASYRNARQLLRVCEIGVGAVSAAPEVIRLAYEHEGVETQAQRFEADFQALCGGAQSMLDCH